METVKRVLIHCEGQTSLCPRTPSENSPASFRHGSPVHSEYLWARTVIVNMWESYFCNPLKVSSKSKKISPHLPLIHRARKSSKHSIHIK